MRQPQNAYFNQLLRTMAPDGFGALGPLLEPVTLSFGLVLGKANLPLECICFPESGIVSVVATAKGVGTAEIGVVGLEGMTGLAVMMGDNQSPENTYVQIPGRGHWIEARALVALLDHHPLMRRQLLGFAHAFASQIAQTALANGRAKIDVRLARWLLMAADRIGLIDMPLTHDLLAVMLGVRRPSITDSIHRLEGENVIHARRSAITIRDRKGLEALAGGFYGVPEREYQRILGSAATLPDEAEPRDTTHGDVFARVGA